MHQHTKEVIERIPSGFFLQAFIVHDTRRLVALYSHENGSILHVFDVLWECESQHMNWIEWRNSLTSHAVFSIPDVSISSDEADYITHTNTISLVGHDF